MVAFEQTPMHTSLMEESIARRCFDSPLYCTQDAVETLLKLQVAENNTNVGNCQTSGYPTSQVVRDERFIPNRSPQHQSLALPYQTLSFQDALLALPSNLSLGLLQRNEAAILLALAKNMNLPARKSTSSTAAAASSSPVPKPISVSKQLSTEGLISSKKTTQKSSDNMGGLIENPNSSDILCGRGGVSNHHPGNLWYRRLLNEYRPQYHAAKKHDKITMSKNIVKLIEGHGGRFLERDGQSWRPISREHAVKKTSQCLRERVKRSKFASQA